MKYTKGKIREIRRLNGDSLEELAEVVGISKDSLRKYEIGQKDIRLSVAIRIAKHYGVTLDRLMGFDEEV